MLQIKQNKERLMVTLPYVAKQEYKTKKITNHTDKIGFFYFILRVTGAFSGKKVNFLMDNISHSDLYQNITELDEISFNNLVELAYKYIKNCD
jgi:hypothetical protein